MRWASTIAEAPTTADAVRGACEVISAGLGAARADLAVVFASGHHGADLADIGGRISSALAGARVVGCSARGVVGAGREVEKAPAISVTAAQLPDVEISPFHTPPTAEIPNVASDAEGVIVIADPYSTDPEACVSELDEVYSRATVIGGLASGAMRPGTDALVLDDVAYDSGLIGVALSGALEVDAVIAQGCRPIGEPMLVTRCQENLILELNEKKPLEVLGMLFESLGPRDRTLFSSSMFLGVEMRDEQVEKKQGDYLIRNVIGLDPERGAVAVAAKVQQWQAVQFHLRDARTSAEDLRAMLDRYKSTLVGAPPRGALMFSCLGRGEGLYGTPNHDSEMFGRLIPEVPLGGFFCNGEIGPVGGTTFLHGYTSAFGLFRQRR